MNQMKTGWVILLLAGIHLTAASANPNDILFQTRADEKTFNWMLDKTRLLISQNKLSDPFSGIATLDADPVIPLSDLRGTPEFARVRSMIGDIFDVDTNDAAIRIRIPKIAYQVHEISVNPKTVTVRDNKLSMDLRAGIRGIDVDLTQGIQVDLLLHDPKSKKLETYVTAVIDPVSIGAPSTLPPLSFDLTLQAKKDTAFSYQVSEYDLGSVPGYVKENLNSINVLSRKVKFSANNIHVNPVVLRINHLSRTLTFDDFKPLVQKKMSEILSTVLTRVGVALKTTIGPNILKNISGKNTKATVVASTERIFTSFSLAEFKQPDHNQVLLRVDGDLCTAKNYQQYKELCTQHEEIVEPVRVISEEDRTASSSEITSGIQHGAYDLAFSASEEYLNRLLATTVNAELWDSMLSEMDLELGPKGAFIVLNEKTKTPQLFLDVLYDGDGNGVQKILINSAHPLEFPLRISTSLHFENRNAVPFLVLKTEELLSDEDEILNGIPEYGLPSHLLKLFKRKIASMVVDMASEVNGKTALELELPMFKGLDLDKTDIEANGHGRLNVYFKL